MKKITLITTGQPATNPRLVKEAETLKSLGYQVSVIYCFYQAWAEAYDVEIIGKHPEMYIRSGGHPQAEKVGYWMTRFRQKIAKWLFQFTKALGMPENAISRTHASAKNIAVALNADLYIAHNLGALPAAVISAKACHAKVGYDAEDMHSGQFLSQDDPDYRLNKYIEERYFTKVDYFTAASPLIADHYRKMYPYLAPTVINNVFPRVDQQKTGMVEPKAPLKLFWFSQTIGADRGLELVIEAIGLVNRDIRFELWGQCPKVYLAIIKRFAKARGLADHQLTIHSPVSPHAIFNIAADFDIGIASETGVPLNRDICLTNKIFTYVQAGLAILASDTQAQSLFLKQYPLAGLIFKKNDPADLAAVLLNFDKDREQLFQVKYNNYHLGQNVLNWEVESRKFMRIIETLQL